MIQVIVEGGIVQGVYVDGQEIEDADVFDLDVDGADDETIAELAKRIEGVPDSDLRRDLADYGVKGADA